MIGMSKQISLKIRRFICRCSSRIKNERIFSSYCSRSSCCSLIILILVNVTTIISVIGFVVIRRLGGGCRRCSLLVLIVVVAIIRVMILIIIIEAVAVRRCKVPVVIRTWLIVAIVILTIIIIRVETGLKGRCSRSADVELISIYVASPIIRRRSGCSRSLTIPGIIDRIPLCC